MIGRRLAHYEISALLGKGGMGEVYHATDTKLGREIALKVLPTDSLPTLSDSSVSSARPGLWPRSTILIS